MSRPPPADIEPSGGILELWVAVVVAFPPILTHHVRYERKEVVHLA
jgi:hypothetical protein